MKTAKAQAAEDSVTESSGNVFADLRLKNPETMLAKAELAIHIKRAIKARGLIQEQTAAILGVEQPKVSAITSGRLTGFSTDRLLRYLNALGCDVKITVSRPHPKTPGHVVFA